MNARAWPRRRRIASGSALAAALIASCSMGERDPNETAEATAALQQPPSEAASPSAARGAEPSRAHGPPDVLLVTLDTTRADRIGAYGYAKGSTPTIDRLGTEGILFESAIAPAPTTLPSHSSILTGLYPVAHGVRDNALFLLDDGQVLVSEVFRDHGWRTGAFVASVVLDPKWGLDQGFDVYRGPSLGETLQERKNTRPADEVVSDAIEFISGLSPEERFFAWVHLFDPHEPYAAPNPWQRRLADPYDAEIAFADSQIDRLLKRLDRMHRTENLLVAVTADHGESLGDHGEQSHGTFIYGATLHVPLVLWGRPLGNGTGTRVAQPVSIAALAATLIEGAGIDRGSLRATALPSLLERGGEPRREATEPILIESFTPYYSFRWRALRGLVDGRYKLVEGRKNELYDLELDPAETNDLAPSRADVAQVLHERLRRTVELHRGRGAATGTLDPGEAERLEALGYVVGTSGGDPLGEGLPDPVERIGDLASIQKAIQLWSEATSLQRGGAALTPSQKQERKRQARLKLESARALLEVALGPPPGNPIARIYLGLVAQAAGNQAEAIALMQQSVRDRPERGRNHANLARAYEAAGRDRDALRAMEEAIRMGPVYPSYLKWIGERSEKDGDPERTAE